MRKIITLLSTLILVSLLMVACGAEETGTAVPGTDLPAEEPTLETPDVTEEPMETPTGEGTGTPDTGIPVTGEEDPSRLSNQLDYDVWNGNGDQIGEVNDMIVDLGNSRVSYVIVGTGGFLEIGERDILVPWDQLELQTSTGDNATGDENAFIFQGDQATFENAPDVDVNAILPPLGDPADDWDVDLRNYWQGGGATTDTTDGTATVTVPEGTAVPEMTGTAAPDTTTVPEDDMGTGELQGVILASELLGSNLSLGTDGTVVENQTAPNIQGTGTPVAPGTAVTTAMPDSTATLTTDTTTPGDVQTGTIDDVLVDIDTGDILYIIVNAAFDDGDRWIPVPLDQFSWDTTNGAFVLDADSAMLSGAPSFDGDQFPDTSVEGWDAEFDAYWQ